MVKPHRMIITVEELAVVKEHTGWQDDKQMIFTIEMLARALYPFAQVCEGKIWWTWAKPGSTRATHVKPGAMHFHGPIPAAHFYFARELLERIAGGGAEAFDKAFGWMRNEVYEFGRR